MATSALDKLIIEIEAKDLLSPEMAKLERRVELFSRNVGKSLLKSEGGAVGGNAEVALGNLGSFAKAGQDADRALALATRGVSGLGGAITSQLGPAGGVVGGLTNEVVALGGGLDSLIGKAGLSEVALLGLGAGAAGIATAATGIGLAAKSALDFESAIKGAVVASAGQGESTDDLAARVRRVSNDLGIAADVIGAAFRTAFDSGAKSAKDAEGQVRRVASLFQNVGFGDSLAESFAISKSAADAFQVSGERAFQLLVGIKSAARDAGGDQVAFAESVFQSAKAARELGYSAESVIKLTANIVRQGASADEARRAVSALFRLKQDPSATGSKIVRGLGIDVDGLTDILELTRQIKAEFADKGGDLSQLAPARDIQAFQKALRELPADLSAGIDAALKSLGAVDDGRIARTALNTERLAKSLTELSNASAAVGEFYAGGIARAAEIASGAVEKLGDAWRSVFGDSERERLLRSSDAMERITEEIKVQEEALARLLAIRNAFDARQENPVTRALDAGSAQASEFRGQSAIDIDAARAQLEELRRQKLIIEGKIEIEPPNFEKSIAEAQARAQALTNARPLVVSVDSQAVETALGNVTKKPLELSADVVAFRESISRVLRQFEGKPIPIKIAADIQKLERIRTNDAAAAEAFGNGGQAEAASLAKANALLTAEEQADALLASLSDRTASVADKQRAEVDRVIAQTFKIVESLRERGVEESKLQEILAKVPAVRSESNRTADLSIAKQTADIEAKMLGLRATSLDRARDLALANGDVATADRLGVEAIQARAEAARALGEIEIANLREQLRGREDLKGQFEAIAKLIRANADAEADAAQAAVDRARDTRTRNTNDLVGDADSALLTGLDAEYDAIERNRRAAIRRAEDGVRAGTVEATALGYLIDQYGALADAERERLAQDVNLQRIEIEAGLVGELTDNYTATAYAIGLARSAERERLALSLAGLNAEQSEIEATLALFDQITQQRQFAAAVAASQRSSTQIEETILLEAAFQRATREAERMGLKGAEAGKYIQDAMLNARTGVDALSAGFRGGFDDFKRDIFDDFSFGAEAARNQAQTFKDSWIDAFGSIGQEGKDAGDILRDFGIANLRQLQKNAAEFAFNKLGQAVLGPPESRKDDGSFLSGLFGGGAKADPLQVSADRLTGSADRLDAAAIALGQAAVGGPTTQGGIGFFGSGFANSPAAIGPGVDGNPLGGFVGPQLPGFEFASGGASDVATQDGLAAELAAAGDTFSTAVEAGGQATAGALVSGGNVFASLLGGVANSLGSALSGFLSSGISASFAEGGRFQGRSMRTLSPLANRLGGKYTNRTLIEVAEIPGLEEAVIPLKGGAIPVEVKGGKRRQDPRLANGPFDELVQQLGRLDLQEQRLRADAPAERERQRARERSDFAVRQADTQRAPVSERRRVGVGADRGERRTAREGRRARAQVVQVGGGQPVVNVSISVSAGGSEDIGSRVREVVPYVVREVIRGLEGENRQLVNAVRGAVG